MQLNDTECEGDGGRSLINKNVATVFEPRVRPSRRTKEIANKLFKDIAAQEVEDGECVEKHS